MCALTPTPFTQQYYRTASIFYTVKACQNERRDLAEKKETNDADIRKQNKFFCCSIHSFFFGVLCVIAERESSRRNCFRHAKASYKSPSAEMRLIVEWIDYKSFNVLLFLSITWKFMTSCNRWVFPILYREPSAFSSFFIHSLAFHEIFDESECIKGERERSELIYNFPSKHSIIQTSTSTLIIYSEKKFTVLFRFLSAVEILQITLGGGQCAGVE